MQKTLLYYLTDFLKNQWLVILVFIISCLSLRHMIETSSANKLLRKQMDRQEQLYIDGEKRQEKMINEKLLVIDEARKESKATTSKIDAIDGKVDKLYLLNTKKLKVKYDAKAKDASNTPIHKTSSILSGNLASDSL